MTATQPTTRSQVTPTSGAEWRTLINLDQRGRRICGLEPIRLCPACWSTHPSFKHQSRFVQITLNEPLRAGEWVTCHICGDIRQST